MDAVLSWRCKCMLLFAFSEAELVTWLRTGAAGCHGPWYGPCGTASDGGRRAGAGTSWSPVCDCAVIAGGAASGGPWCGPCGTASDGGGRAGAASS